MVVLVLLRLSSLNFTDSFLFLLFAINDVVVVVANPGSRVELL